MVDTFAEQAKAYWRSWGILGEHMVRNVDSWAKHQRSYIDYLRQNRGGGSNRPET
jgi:molybdate-binding protein